MSLLSRKECISPIPANLPPLLLMIFVEMKGSVSKLASLLLFFKCKTFSGALPEIKGSGKFGGIRLGVDIKPKKHDDILLSE